MFRWRVFIIPLIIGICALAETNAEAMRDPTQPMSFSVATKARPKLVLQAIYFGAGRKQAVVNGKLVSEGDEVSQAVITAISSSRVYYRQGAHTGSLSVRPKVSKATQ